MSEKTIKTFNKNLETLLHNILESFEELRENLEQVYVVPLHGDTYLKKFIEYNKNKGHDISNKNEIIFSKQSHILEHIDFNYIWNHSQMTQENKNIIWKYIQSLYLYSLEYSEHIDIKQILLEYKQTNRIDNDTTRKVINILNNLSNKPLIENNSNSIEDEENEQSSTFKLPDLSNFIGKHIMELGNNIMKDIDLESVTIEQPLELVQTLLDGKFNLETDTTGVALLVEKLINNLKTNLLSEDLDKQALLKELKNVLQMFNNITNNNYNLDKVFQTLETDEFTKNFDTIINSLNFEFILSHLIDIIDKLKTDSNIDVTQVMTQLKDTFATQGLNSLNSLTNIPQLMGLVSNLMGNKNSDTEQDDGVNNIHNLMSSLNLGDMFNNIMSDMNVDGSDETTPDMSNIDIGSIFNSIKKNLPQELIQNLPSQLGEHMSSDVLNQLSENIDLDQIKKMADMAGMAGMAGMKGNVRINHSKLNQLTRLEKKREQLRKKLAERKRSLHQETK